ncbi:Arrestin domain-containing protein [Aspergillus sp. HF37]|nr:Arrestin domain-containing protein [Aspergillus sp. HF37]
MDLMLNGKSSVQWLDGRRDTEAVVDQTSTLFDSKLAASRAHHLGQFQRRKQAQSVPQSGQDESHFLPGTHDFGFEFVLAPQSPESISLQRTHVRYTLHAVVHRSGLWNHDIEQTREFTVARCPTDNVPDVMQPISTTETSLKPFRYEVVAAARAVPLGHRLSVSVTSTPLSQSRCCRLMIYLVEDVRCKRHPSLLYRLDSSTKALLFAGSDSQSRPGVVLPTPSHPCSVDSSDDAMWAGLDQCEILRNTGHSQNQAGDVPSAAVDLEIGLPLPPCHTHAECGSSPMHCDTEYKNVQVSHYLNVSISNAVK